MAPTTEETQTDPAPYRAPGSIPPRVPGREQPVIYEAGWRGWFRRLWEGDPRPQPGRR